MFTGVAADAIGSIMGLARADSLRSHPQPTWERGTVGNHDQPPLDETMVEQMNGRTTIDRRPRSELPARLAAAIKQ
jgi:hypothetical protein